MPTSDPRVIAAYEEALFTIARATVQTRQRVQGFHIPPDAAQNLLVECEAALTGLVALGAVPHAERRAVAPPRADRAATYAELGAAAELLRRQVRLDREQSRYWADRSDQLDAVETWLESLMDWSGR